jgi:serine/threonine protein kinase
VLIARTLALLLVPISLGISVMRYRLWDLDLTINRSVVGAIVTALLAAVFAGVFFGAQALIQALFGPQSSAFAIAAGALVIGALFVPVRRRVRNFVDRRIYDFRFNLNELRDAQKLPEVKQPGALTGQSVGAYQILDVLGRGGMGEVYKGFGGERVVAVKIMPPEIAKDTKNAARFEREIEALKLVDHPNVVHLLDAGVQGDQRYMVMDYIEGTDLTHYIRDHGAFEPDTAHQIAKQIGAALSYIHERGQVHRDVTSGNIMISGEADAPRAVLMDFGLVKLIDRPTNITMSGDVMGTIDYMSPEQIIQTQTVDFRADIYALGAVYFEMLTGRRVFTGGPAQVLFAHLYQPPPNPRDVRPELPKPLAAVIMQALAKSPDERFKSVADFIAAAAAAQQEAAVAA